MHDDNLTVHLKRLLFGHANHHACMWGKVALSQELSFGKGSQNNRWSNIGGSLPCTTPPGVIVRLQERSRHSDPTTNYLRTLRSCTVSSLFDCSHKLKKLPIASASEVGSGIKLPKLDVPTFNGNILHWKQFCSVFPSTNEPSSYVYNMP